MVSRITMMHEMLVHHHSIPSLCPYNHTQWSLVLQSALGCPGVGGWLSPGAIPEGRMYSLRDECPDHKLSRRISLHRCNKRLDVQQDFISWVQDVDDSSPVFTLIVQCWWDWCVTFHSHRTCSVTEWDVTRPGRSVWRATLSCGWRHRLHWV